MTTIRDTWIYQFFRWYRSCQKFTQHAFTVKAAAFLTEIPIGKFWFSHIFNETLAIRTLNWSVVKNVTSQCKYI